MVAICRTREELRLALPHDRRIAVVMTMGALHAGHAALIDAARRDEQAHVTVTVFVNPTQFGPDEDLERYPRSPNDDIALATAHGAEAVFLPGVTDVYGSGGLGDISIDPGALGRILEGDGRPGHFAGVLTVVLALLHITGANIAYFGEKDYQQLALVKAMVRRFAMPVRVVGVPTVRDSDGLALSSRNAYLGERERKQALALPDAMFAARVAAAAGADADVVTGTALAVLRDAGLEPAYVELTDPELGPPPRMGAARLLAAVPVGSTRLIDNIALELRGAA